MKHSKQGLQTVQVIYQEKYLKLSTLKALTVPRVYPHEIALVRFIQSLEQSGDAILETVCLRVRKRILGVSLTELGVSRWIEGKRDDICKRRRYKVDYSTRPVELPPKGESEDKPNKKKSKVLHTPCMAKLNKCFHNDCYLKYECYIRQEYKEIQENFIKSEEQLMEEL